MPNKNFQILMKMKKFLQEIQHSFKANMNFLKHLKYQTKICHSQKAALIQQTLIKEHRNFIKIKFLVTQGNNQLILEGMILNLQNYLYLIASLN